MEGLQPYHWRELLQAGHARTGKENRSDSIQPTPSSLNCSLSLHLRPATPPPATRFGVQLVCPGTLAFSNTSVSISWVLAFAKIYAHISHPFVCDQYYSSWTQSFISEQGYPLFVHERQQIVIQRKGGMSETKKRNKEVSGPSVRRS